MTAETLTALSLYAIVSSITPGPNNLMLMSSGLNFGFRRSLPHMLGIGIGFTLLIILCGLGLGQVFTAWPLARTLLKVAAVAYMLWLAWKIARSAPPEGAAGTARPLSFLQAAGFQYVNPKAWVMALSAVSVYAPDQSLHSVLLVAAVFGALNLPCVSVWTAVGTALRRWLQNPRWLRIFNYTMAGLLILSLWPALQV